MVPFVGYLSRFPHLQIRLASSCKAFVIFQPPIPDSSSPTLSSLPKVRRVEQRRCLEAGQSRQTKLTLAAALPNISQTSKMLDIRNHALHTWRMYCARFKQDWTMIFMLVLGDPVSHSLDPSNGIHPLVGILVLLCLLPFFTSLLVGLFFEFVEKEGQSSIQAQAQVRTQPQAQAQSSIPRQQFF
jgi:hypothetical protein